MESSMDYCTVCKKAMATIHILDLQEGKVVEQQSLCGVCAENTGAVHPKTASVKITTEALEDLIGSLKGAPGLEGEATLACPACDMTLAQFRTRGRLGCPRCYETFHKSLLPLLERVHDATSHRGRFPVHPSGRTADTPTAMRGLRNRLNDAIKSEDYEEAANLRDEIRRLEQQTGPDSGKESGN